MKRLLTCVLFFSVLSANATKSKGVIDLGSGEVESNIQGAQYLLRIRGSLAERIKNLEDSVDQQVFKEIEARHLTIAGGERQP